MNGPTAKRLLHLDGLRCFAFLFVFVHHAFHVPMLWAGVDLFFVLSGYLITGILIESKYSLKLSRRDYFRTFYFRRILRIFPPYYLFLLIAFCFVPPENRRTWPLYAAFLSNFNEAYHWLPRIPSLNPLWSLAVEEQFYLVWPFLIWIFNIRQMTWFSISLLLLAPLCRMSIALTHTQHWPAFYLLPCRIDLLAAGTLLAFAQASLSQVQFDRATRHGLATAIGALVVFVLLNRLFPSFRTGKHTVLFHIAGYSLLLVMATGLLAYLIPRADGYLGRILSFKPFVFVGTVSYSTYLVHQFILDQIQGWGQSKAVTAVAALCITLAIATVSWFALERPLNRLKSCIAPYRHSTRTLAESSIQSGGLNPAEQPLRDGF